MRTEKMRQLRGERRAAAAAVLLFALSAALMMGACGKKTDSAASSAETGIAAAESTAAESAAGETAADAEDSGQILKPGDLPAFRFTGEAAWMDALLDDLIKENGGAFESGDVMIPNFVIFRVKDEDPDYVRVWGNFWLMNYELEGQSLQTKNGGSFPGKFTLRRKDGIYQVSERDMVGDGSDYQKDAERVFGEDDELFSAWSTQDQVTEENRKKTIQRYAEEWGLPLTSYQDPGWDPVLLTSSRTENEPAFPDIAGKWTSGTGMDTVMSITDDPSAVYPVRITITVSPSLTEVWRMTGKYEPDLSAMQYGDGMCIRRTRDASGKETEETVSEGSTGTIVYDSASGHLIWHPDQEESREGTVFFRAE